VEHFKFSKDPQFVQKVRDIVGLYMNPPDDAIVLCVDEKSQVQALNRTQPILPLAPGVPQKLSNVQAWLARHPRHHVHFTPTSASWLNLVGRLFAEVTDRYVRRGSHTAVRALERAMLEYLDQRNHNPKPFVWTADADLILGKVQRGCHRTYNSGH
jgi:hypothetical protein